MSPVARPIKAPRPAGGRGLRLAASATPPAFGLLRSLTRTRRSPQPPLDVAQARDDVYTGRMSELEQLRKKRDQVLAMAASHGATNVRVFGSVATGLETEQSDIDLLVSLEAGRNLFDLCRLYDALEELLDRPVDIVVDGGISPLLEDRILREAVPL